MLTLTNGPPARRGGVDGVRQQLLAGAGLAQQQHRAGDCAARRAWRLTSAAAGLVPTKLAKVYLARRWPSPAALPSGRCAGQLAPGVVQVALQQRKLADQRLQRGLGVVKQHDADGADHLAIGLVAQRNAADHKGAGLVGQQVDQHRVAGLQHAAHLGVGDHVFHHVADELVHRRKAQRGKSAGSPR
jgi:hypothetical protein